MTKFLQNKAVRILGLIFLIVFLPFIPISFLIYKAHNKFSGLTKILIIAPLVIVFLLSFIWSRAIFLPSKSQNLQVETSKNTPTQTIKPSSTEKKTLYKVVKVIDGDTIDVEINGKKETLRLIGIDTPETVDPRKPVQCFGKEASDKARAILSGKNVALEADPTQGERDKYNRLLRYVFLEDEISFNKYMISEGYAHEYTYQSNPYKYQAEYKQAEKNARENKRGLWADNACPTVIAPTKTPIQIQTPEQPPSNTGGYTCNCSKTCTQISSCDEAYFQLNQCGCSARDRDRDGVPCESLCR